MARALRLAALLSAGLLAGVAADDHTHTYEDGEEVTLWMNKVGPYHNPQETYDYFSLPFCRPSGKEIRHKFDSLGVILEGTELTDSGLAAHFKVNQEKTVICDISLTEESQKVFTDAVRQHYWYQMYIDELPIWGMVGEYMQAEYEPGTTPPPDQPSEHGFLYTHKDFSISYNGNRIIEVNLTSENPQMLTAGLTYPTTFSVKWVETKKPFATRFDRYLDFDFFEHQIHWFSIFNSFMMVVFLCGLVSLILMRTLKQDYARYTNEDDDMELDRVVDESGWKQVHGDVFRPPRHLVLYSAALGTGYQLFFMVFCVIVLTIMGDFYDERGSVITTFLVCYSLTSFVAGYTGGSFYKRHAGEHWKQSMGMTTVLFPSIVLSVASVLNLIAIFYQSLATITVGTVFAMGCIWLLVSCPLVLAGTIAGRSMSVAGDFPCRINALHRPIPDGKWYTKPATLALLAGLLPFGSIFIEMYFIFTSFWNYKFYYVYGFVFLVYCILIIVTVCVTVVETYFLLNAEDHRWHWTAFLAGGSTAGYVYLYAIYFFFTKTRMSGVLQTSFYFGYMGVFCVGLFLLCGTIGYMGSSIFVRRIYANIKSD